MFPLTLLSPFMGFLFDSFIFFILQKIVIDKIAKTTETAKNDQ